MNKYYHITATKNVESILENGLIPQVGARGQDGLGNQLESKVFFTQNEEGLFGLLNTAYDNVKRLIRTRDFLNLRKAFDAISDNEWEQIEEKLKKLYEKDEVDLEEETNVLYNMLDKYFENSTLLELDVKITTTEEYRNMSDEEKEKIDCISDSFYSDTPELKMRKTDMCTIPGRGIDKSKIKALKKEKSEGALPVILDIRKDYIERRKQEFLKENGHEMPQEVEAKIQEEKLLPEVIFKDYEGNDIIPSQPISVYLAQKQREVDREEIKRKLEERIDQISRNNQIVSGITT